VDPTTMKALTADQRGYQPSGMADIGAFQDLGFTLTAVTMGGNPGRRRRRRSTRLSPTRWP
jgi:hypothetical protein